MVLLLPLLIILVSPLNCGLLVDARLVFGSNVIRNRSVDTPKLREKRILVTGYEAFHNFSNNPAATIAMSLNGHCYNDFLEGKTQPIRICWEGWSVPVNHEGASKVSTMIQQGKEKPWDAIIHLGLEFSSKGLKLETVAMNIFATEFNPSQNVAIPSCDIYAKIHETGDCILPTTSPMNKLNIPRDVLEHVTNEEEGQTLAWSRDAGGYFCNEIYYRTLHAVREFHQELTSPISQNLTPVMFIHLPDPKFVGIEHSQRLVEFIGNALVL